ncbi:DUF3244 domain-containing protein [Natrinema sp. DC36]|uniref:DUF3244 domain-containing protein n=1 Tax=Natrinema sp. DC36 TaxID=2878680 RepID=UPI001CEFFF55|nr:DUF3244 domain-containing protein [Natrinema sp. DC36]
MSQAQAHDTPESGTLPGRYEWVPEPDGPMSVPTDIEWNRFSDVIRSFSAESGVSYARQDAIGTADAVDHNRGTEEPSADIGYDLQRFPVDVDGNPIDPSAYGILRDEYNQLLGSLLMVERTEIPGGNDGAGIRVFSVVRGAEVESVEPTLDPSSEQPILMELGLQPRKVRSVAIHQPSAGTTLEIVSDDADDTMDVTIENEDASTTETIALNGTTAVTTTESFGDIDSIWLSGEPTGDITITDGSGTTICELAGGLTYSDDDQPVDGDRGVPPLGAGSHAAEIGTTFEHFLGDRIERPVGTPVRPRLNSGSWAIENDLSTDSVHTSRAPTVDPSDRTVTVDADVAGPTVSHDSMMESLQKTQNDIEHELSGGIVRFKNTVNESPGSREREASGQATAAISETFAASGDPAIELEAN